MTIADALARYESKDVSASAPALRDVVNKLIDANVKTEFDNDSYLDALILTEVMFNRSESSIRLLTGGGAGKFLEALKESFTGALVRLGQNGGKVRVLLLAKDIPEWLQGLTARFPQVLKIYRALAEDPVRHFIVCDRKMARHEETHGQITDDTPASAIKAKVSFNEPGKAQLLEAIFDSMWDVVGEFPLNKVRRN